MNARVIGPATFELLPGGRTVKLTKRLVFLVDDKILAAPPGFETDFASVPRPFWSIFPPMGKYTKAAIVHDYLYFSGIMSRKEADKVFLILMKQLGVLFWKRRVMYRAVRVGGWLAWRGHRKNDRSSA